MGKNMMNIKDKYGKCLACDFVRIAREKGMGWSQYWWPKPGSGELSLKISYIMKVPNHELFVGVGVYDMTLKEVEAAIKKSD
ncbi:Double Cache 2 domain-containing protein [Desulfonema magnum]|uniref:Double Cache 2 domain-containing protein n=1 Tax=Desulfonema magnum TaxID=45655 RepID=A0A975GP97_9BACT|nr:Double Cache 2 domain-containing protein [Desulfonema magnum]